MAQDLTVAVERFPIAGRFTISRGSRTEAAVVTATIAGDGARRARRMRPLCTLRRNGRGRRGGDRERAAPHRNRARPLCVAGAASARRGAQRARLRAVGSRGQAHPRAGARRRRPPAPPAAIDGLHDQPRTPEAMAEAARRRGRAADPEGQARRRRRSRPHPGGARRPPRAPHHRSTPTRAGRRRTSERNLAACAELGFALIEQPLPADRDGCLRGIARPVPICADESVHDRRDLDRLVGLYDAVNIKLDKTGGLTEALALARRGRRRRLLAIMVGCMVGDLARHGARRCCWRSAPASSISTARCSSPETARTGCVYEGGVVHPPSPALWG